MMGPSPAVILDPRAPAWGAARTDLSPGGAPGPPVAPHEGAHTPFTADLTHVPAGGGLEVAVRAEDDPHDLAKPRGKQDWQLQPHSIWYPRTTGVWQSVWLEVVPATSVGR